MKRVHLPLFISLSAVCILFSSCVKEDQIVDKKEYPEFIVFGTFLAPSNCSGSEACVELYKIDGGELNEDVMDGQPSGGSAYPGEYTHSISTASYQNVMDIFENNPVPQELLDSPSGVLGNLNQWGTNFYFEYKTSTGYHYWIIGGAFDGSLPTVIQNYLNVINTATFTAAQG